MASILDYFDPDLSNADEIVDLNLAQFADSENINILFDIFKDFYQEAYETQIDVANGWRLLGAEGAQLDYLGQEMDIPRSGYNDEEYKLYALIISKARGGTTNIEDILELLRVISGDKNATIIHRGFKTITINMALSCQSVVNVAEQLSHFIPILGTVDFVFTIPDTGGGGVVANKPLGFEGNENAFPLACGYAPLDGCGQLSTGGGIN